MRVDHQHQAMMSNSRLVEGEPRGRFVHYRLSHSRIEALLGLADELLAGTALDPRPQEA